MERNSGGCETKTYTPKKLYKMSKFESYRKQQLPNFIEKLKSMVALNFEIMTEPIASDISKEKYYNIVKGRRTAAEQSIKGMKKVDIFYKELNNLDKTKISSYYKKNLPVLIDNLKQMFQLNLKVIDIKIDKEEGEWITEEKLYNLVKSRDMGAEDSDWTLTKIEELETELNNKEEELVKKSWALKGLAEDEN